MSRDVIWDSRPIAYLPFSSTYTFDKTLDDCFPFIKITIPTTEYFYANIDIAERENRVQKLFT